MPDERGRRLAAAADERGRRLAAAADRSMTPVPPRPAQPVALLYGPGHKVVHANAAFVAEFGVVPIGVPAVEALLELPPIVLEVADRVLAAGRPLAAWVTVRGVRRRLTVAPRTDIETGEVYGVVLGLAPALAPAPAPAPTHTPDV